MDWDTVKAQRDRLIQQVEWRVERNEKEKSLGVTPTDKIEKLEEYIQKLKDVTLQKDPKNIEYPSLFEPEVQTDWDDDLSNGVPK
tara:strand:- start:40 stop:294 length:255 start_codon:yes stop_codon:yes gene_type:complete